MTWYEFYDFDEGDELFDRWTFGCSKETTRSHFSSTQALAMSQYLVVSSWRIVDGQ